ncbi:putative F-box protein At2g16290 [Silene latifolia]|uniref:putative F-box protein At2g16290 n=1 Tax=Silene latifolia TaxID=37657 RepID=UPI003D772AA5
MASWTALPLDVLGAIAMKLETIEDFICFSAVCRYWNHVSTLIKHQWRPIPVPWLLLAENTHENPGCVRKIFNLANNKCYQLRLPETFRTRCWGSAYGWVAMIDTGFNCQLFNPLTKAHISFPSLKNIVIAPQTYEDEDDEEYICWLLTGSIVRVIVLKVSQNGHDEFAIMVLYKDWEAAVFARHGDQSWTPVLVRDSPRHASMVDVVAMNGHVFVLYEDGQIEFWNVEEFHHLGLVKPRKYSPNTSVVYASFKETGAETIYLVQSGSDLLMVLRCKIDLRYKVDDYAYRNNFFEVYRLNPKEKNWEEIEDLGDRALFVGGNASMCVSVTHATNLQPGCIYFTDDDYDCWEMQCKPSGRNMGVYDLKNEQVWQFYEGDDTHSNFCPPTLFIPQL